MTPLTEVSAEILTPLLSRSRAVQAASTNYTKWEYAYFLKALPPRGPPLQHQPLFPPLMVFWEICRKLLFRILGPQWTSDYAEPKPTTRLFHHHFSSPSPLLALLASASLMAAEQFSLPPASSQHAACCNDATGVRGICPVLVAETSFQQQRRACIAILYYDHLQICQRNGILGHIAGHLKTQRYAKHEPRAFRSHPNYFTFT